MCAVKAALRSAKAIDCGLRLVFIEGFPIGFLAAATQVTTIFRQISNTGKLDELKSAVNGDSSSVSIIHVSICQDDVGISVNVKLYNYYHFSVFSFG